MASMSFPSTILVLFSLLSVAHAASNCCVWKNMAVYVSTADIEGGLAAAPSVPPNATCSWPYSFSSCSGKCLIIECKGTFKGTPGTKYTGICTSDAYTNLGAAELQSGLQSAGAIGVCTEFMPQTTPTPNTTTPPPTTPVPPVPEPPPLTASDVSSAATTGSLGGSIAGSLIAAVVGWLLQNLGPITLKFIMGRAYKQARGRFNKCIDPGSDAEEDEEEDDDEEKQSGGARRRRRSSSTRSGSTRSQKKTPPPSGGKSELVNLPPPAESRGLVSSVQSAAASLETAADAATKAKAAIGVFQA
jgi:hypothetical protein